MSEVEVVIDMPAEYSSMVFGQFDEYAKAIESNLNIELIARDGVVKIIGAEANVIRARGVLDNLIELARRGNQISRQSVDYAISLSFDDKQDTMLEIDSDTVCRTIRAAGLHQMAAQLGRIRPEALAMGLHVV